MPIEICIKMLNGDGEALIYYYTFFRNRTLELTTTIF